MRHLMLLAAAALTGVSGAAMAQDPAPKQDATSIQAVKVTKAVEQKASKAVRLSDAELDKVTAGDHFGFTVIINPGHEEIVKFNNNRWIFIIGTGG
jgi:hypothetical protein